MRLSKTLPTLAACLVVLSPAPAAGPPLGLDPGQPIDTLIDAVKAKRKAVDDAKSAQATAEAELKQALEALNKRLAELGLNGPTPGPVNPPTPTPPVDPLAARLWAAYRADASATKGEVLKDLIELMRQAGSLADDPSLATVGQLAGKVAAVAGTLAKDQLTAVRAILKAELAAAFPEDGPLTATVRAAAKATFGKLQTALTEAGK